MSAFVVGTLFTGIATCCERTTVSASGPGYQYIEQTINENVVVLTEKIAEKYPIAPELIQAIVFYESSNIARVQSKQGDTGYMQVNPKWHKERMDKLGVTDLYDGYSNILVGTDYLVELCEKYHDIVTALMVYHGERNAVERAEVGEISEYAKKILDLSEKLERLNGK